MAAFVCEVVLDLAPYVWAELHFANYFPVAEFSACRSSHSLSPRREARQQVLSQPYSGCKIASGLWWTVGEGGAAWDRATARAKAWRRKLAHHHPSVKGRGEEKAVLVLAWWRLDGARS